MYDINAVGGTFVHMVVLYTKKHKVGVMKVKYMPPSPPSGTGEHNYIFELFELDKEITKEDPIGLFLANLNLNRTIDDIKLFYKNILSSLEANNNTVKKDMENKKIGKTLCLIIKSD